MTDSMEESFAAIDLGSNSFHMIVARYKDGRLQVIDRLKDMVRLASGLDEKGRLSDEAMQRAIECLERFGQRIREIPRINVRAVGTNTLRQARNSRIFQEKVRRALGHPVEIISGREEARLIFLGVAHTIYNDRDRRLVVDIGGGSTELIIGRGYEPGLTESLSMGCVNVSQRFFDDGQITAKRMHRALLACRQGLEAIEALYRRAGWDAVIGSSGTISTINDVVIKNGWSDTGITATSLESLSCYLIETGHADKLKLEGLSERRRPVFAGGVSVLRAVFEGLAIDHMTFSDGALREGLLYDLLGRVHDEDIRADTVSEVSQRYQVDREQAERVAATALDLFEQVRRDWRLNHKGDRKLLEWGARLHEIGLSISHSQYHRHGAYLLTHADLPGFSRPEQYALAMLVQAHRRKFPGAELEALPAEDRERVTRLCLLLRLAVVLNRGRTYTAPPKLGLSVSEKELRLRLPEDWAKAYPLTVADLEQEQDYLKAAGFQLDIE
jgi:exopolyphosphatase/guanosine-5'-triphosphate,3'-diphosphate pyrophosphatase